MVTGRPGCGWSGTFDFCAPAIDNLVAFDLVVLVVVITATINISFNPTSQYGCRPHFFCLLGPISCCWDG